MTGFPIMLYTLVHGELLFKIQKTHTIFTNITEIELLHLDELFLPPQQITHA